MILFLKYSVILQYPFEVYDHIPQLRSGIASDLCNNIPLFPVLLSNPSLIHLGWVCQAKWQY